MSNFIEILLVGARRYRRADRKDMTKLVCAFTDYTNAPKKCDGKVALVHPMKACRGLEV